MENNFGDNIWPRNTNRALDLVEPDWDFINYMDRLEKDWSKSLKENLPKNDLEWLEIFPEAKTIIPDKIKEWEYVASKPRKQVKGALEIINKKSAKENQWFWREVLKYNFSPVKDLAIANYHIKRLQRLLPQNRKNGVLWNQHVEDARKHDLVSVAEHYRLKLYKSGNHYKTLCISHNEHTPSLVIYPSSKFYCFGCHTKGDVITFVQIIENCSFKEAVLKLQNI